MHHFFNDLREFESVLYKALILAQVKVALIDSKQ